MQPKMTKSGRKHGSAKVEPGLRGLVQPLPRAVVEGFSCKQLLGLETEGALAIFELNSLVAAVAVPVRETTGGCRLNQTTRDDWDRRLVVPDGVEPPKWFFPPVLLSPRTMWHRRGGYVEVFGQAYVIDGAHRLELAARSCSPRHVPVVMAFGLEEKGELLLRADLTKWNLRPVEERSEARIDTATPRLHLSDAWVQFRVESDPFLVPTARGYAPALLIRRREAAQREHILIGAKSLANPLEKLRIKYGTLTGLFLQVRKESEESKAPYMLCETD